TMLRPLPVIEIFTLRFLPLSTDSLSRPRMLGAPRREAAALPFCGFAGSTKVSVPVHRVAAVAEQLSVSGTVPWFVIVAAGCRIDSGGAGGFTGAAGGLMYSQLTGLVFGSGVFRTSAPSPQSIEAAIRPA